MHAAIEEAAETPINALGIKSLPSPCGDMGAERETQGNEGVQCDRILRI